MEHFIRKKKKKNKTFLKISHNHHSQIKETELLHILEFINNLYSTQEYNIALSLHCYCCILLECHKLLIKDYLCDFFVFDKFLFSLEGSWMYHSNSNGCCYCWSVVRRVSQSVFVMNDDESFKEVFQFNSMLNAT